MLKTIRIRNFRSLIDVTVELAPLTVLIGRSGTGKSNFLRAIRFMRDILATSQVPDWTLLHSIVPVSSGLPLQIAFDLTFDVPGIDGDFIFGLTLEITQHRQTILGDEYLSIKGKNLYKKAAGKWIDKPALHTIPDVNSLQLATLSGLQEVTFAHAVLSQGIGCYDFPHGVLTGNETSNVPGLRDLGQNHISVMSAILSNLQGPSHWKEIIAALAQLNPAIVSLDMDRPNPSQVSVGHEIEGKILTLNLAQESEGFRRFLAHLIALYQFPPKQILLFEEPEKGIYPGALAVLADQFKTAYSGGRGQIILTTHSPQLLDDFVEPDSIRVVELSGHATKIGPMAADQIESVREKLLTTGQLLTVEEPRIQE